MNTELKELIINFNNGDDTNKQKLLPQILELIEKSNFILQVSTKEQIFEIKTNGTDYLLPIYTDEDEIINNDYDIKKELKFKEILQLIKDSKEFIDLKHIVINPDTDNFFIFDKIIELFNK